jgi:hypothetical protein
MRRTYETRRRPHWRAFVVLAACVVLGTHCSLLAPSDSELMGGRAVSDASSPQDARAGDARVDGDAPACRAETQDCTVDGDCCSASCSGGKCAACLAAGQFCNGVPARCCSGACNGAAGKKCD